MKRNLLAIAIPALLVAGAANASIEIYNKDGNKLEVNGRVHAFNYMSKAGKNGTLGTNDQTDARLGFTGETQITDSLIGYGRAEWNTTTGKGASVENRYAFAGFKFGNLGQLDYGRNDGISKTLTNYTDVLPEFGGNATEYVVLGQRTSGVLTYRNSDFFGLVDGLGFGLQYADSGAEKGPTIGVSDLDPIVNTKEAYGASLEYAIPETGLTLGAAYSESTGKNDPNVIRARSYLAGVKYDANDLYLAGLYTHTEYRDSDESLNGFEVVAQYGFDFEVGRLTPSIAYIQHKDKVSGVSSSVEKYVDLGLTYDFNKNISAIVDYKINLLDKDDNSTNYKDTVALGVIYAF